MFDFTDVEESLNSICKNCADYGTSECVKSKCYVGFAQFVINYYKEKSVPAIENGSALIPIDDMKSYPENLVADSIAQVCKVCHECRENHNEQCVVSLIRRSLEDAVFQENTPYKGSVLMYLMDLSNQDERLAGMIKEAFLAK